MSVIGNGIPDKALLEARYEAARPGYEKALSTIVHEISALLKERGIHPTIKSRIKDFESYFSKKIRLMKEGWDLHRDPLPVNDVLAMRIICPFLGDLDEAEAALVERYHVVEIERKGQDRSFREFGYESIHVLIEIPESLKPLCADLEREVIEIQLRTILQEAWAEVEHELVYKAEFTPFDEPLKRKLAALNANLTLSDIIFQEILDYQKKLTSALRKRREDFYRKIELDTASAFGLADAPVAGFYRKRRTSKTMPIDAVSSASAAGTEAWKKMDLDSLLLTALDAHNNADFKTAIAIYSEILSRKPEAQISAVVYKHRGMAHFTQSDYQSALSDFTSCVALDPDCYKALYYRGVVKSIMGDTRQAIDDFSKALEIHPYHFYSRYRRALCWWQIGDMVQAHTDCELALRIDPENRLARDLMERVKEHLAKDEI